MMKTFRICYWYEDSYDATYDCEEVIEIKANSEDEAIAEFRNDYGSHNIMFILPLVS